MSTKRQRRERRRLSAGDRTETTSSSLWRLGLRRESLILLPVAMLLLVALSAATLVSFRNGIEELINARRSEATRLAQRLAGLLASGQVTTFEGLQPYLPDGARLALVGEEGSSRGQIGRFEIPDLLDPASGRELSMPFAVGPGESAPGWIVAFAPVEWHGARHSLRVDLEARRLAAQRTAVKILFGVVLGVGLAVAALVVLFLRNLLMPYETMLARARQIRPVSDGGEDEIAYLLGTFEQALAALAGSAPDRSGADIVALQRTLGSSLESGLLLLDTEGGVLSLNELGARLLAVAVPEPGTPMEVALANCGELSATLRDAVAKEKTVQRREIRLVAGAKERTLGFTVHPLRREEGRPRAFLVLFADLTESRRAQEEQRLSATLAQVGELSAGLAHEMRNSLATLSGYLALMRRARDGDTLDEYVQELGRETDHVRRVLEDFLSFARPGSTRMEQIDLERVVRRAAADPALSAAEIRFERWGERSAAVHGDSQLLERAVRNLLHNAADAHKRVARSEAVEVVLEVDGSSPILKVADRGDGVAAAVRERLFQPFVSSTAEGVGLGLALARRIVELHGGRLSLEDRSGGGTVATVQLEFATVVTDSNESESTVSTPDS